MVKMIVGLLVLLGMLFAMPLVSAFGYGTSSISLSTYNANITKGAGISINYTVNLATGSSWGTTVVVNNQNQLQSEGINITLSHAYNYTVPFSGYMGVNVGASAASGSYKVILSATGDDPSTQNTTLNVTVPAPAKSSGGTTSTITVAPTTTVSAVTTVGYSSPPPSAASGMANTNEILAAVTIILLIISGYFIMKMKSVAAKLIAIGIALIIIGNAVWLYGDFAGAVNYALVGIALLLVGTLVWIVGDYKGGAFASGRITSMSSIVIIIGILVLLAGIGVWIYGDFYSGGINAVWAGLAAITVGTIIWIVGDYQSGMFVM